MADIDREQLAELLSAYLDGETDARETDLVERVLRDDTVARHLLEELRRTSDLVSTLPRHTAPPSIAGDLRTRAERTELLGDFEGAPARTTGGRSLLAGMLSVAAVLTLIVVGVSWYTGRATGPGTSGDIVAMVEKDDDAEEPAEAPRREEHVAKKGSKAYSSTRRDRGSRETTVALQEKEREGVKKGPTEVRKQLASSPRRKKGRGEPQPSTPAIAIPQMTEAVFLAKADIEQKLASGVDVAAVREHPFANEPVRLQIMLRNTAQRETASMLLTRSLARQHLVDLSTKEDKTATSEDELQAFYYRGKQGVNFAETDQRQILVRVPANDLPGLFDGIARIPGAGERVALLSGPAVVRGLRNARRALLATEESARLGQQADAGARGRGKGPADARERSEAEELGTPRGGLYDELRKIVNLAPLKEQTATADSDGRTVRGPAPMPPGAGRKTKPRADKIASKGTTTTRPAHAEALPPRRPPTEAGVDRMGEATAEPVEVAADTKSEAKRS